ncbi:DUF2977 domain-containing protein [Staphylococcus xylosus]|uniref:DUF2977 domain-containing protein n=1 Tax=Staphylococcus xylosus TaxID=1288 RepID=UPI0015C57780|nr:DUF2977 domain-containing protein [Staphylococcus xylosus]NQE00510.1 DUF2977 domain-containing protein [Staphylococcus xylosus]
MRILINKKNEIVDYAIVGSLDGDFEIDDSIVPQDFMIYFKPKRYLYNEGTIEVNSDFEEDIKIDLPTVPPTIVAPGTDEELRSMFANMQIQIVEANTMIYEMSEQNARLAQEIVDIKSELNNTKGE